MKKTLKIGHSDFKTIIEDNGYFVDKTMFVKGFFESSSYTLLMPRPKRFGKTLNLSMIEHFFDIRK
ncbi:MAG: AAA family ATPase, partial [Bacteroidetes bacterium 4484_276]